MLIYRVNSIGHFTAMVQDRCARIGCAMSSFVRDGRNFILLACNYSFTNVIGSRVYQIGATGSSCESGRNPLNPGLCSTDEGVLPKPMKMD